MTAHSRIHKLFGLHQPKTSRASRQRSRRQTHVARMLLEQMEDRVMLSAAIVTTTNGPTGVAQPTAWMGQLADSIPLTDISMPGTVNSASGSSLASDSNSSQQWASGSSLQDALLGSGSSTMVSPPDATKSAAGVVNAVLAAHEAAAVAAETAIVAGGSNQAANVAATAAVATASAADVAAGITQTSTGAGLAIGLASDAAWLTSAIATNVQTGLSSTDATADTAAATANTAAATADTAAGTAATAAGTADAAAGAANATAATADTAAGAADATAGTADAAAGTADGVADGLDAAAIVADDVSLAQTSIDPVTDGVAAAADTAGAVADTAAVAANTAADVANVAADAANATADTANTAAGTANAAAAAPNAAVAPAVTAATTADTAAGTADAAAVTVHTAAAVADGTSAASYVAGAAADGMSAQQYTSFAAGMLAPGSTTANPIFVTAGNNPNNTSYQNTIYGLAATAATAHSASAAAEAAAAIADTAATVQNTTAVAANTAAVSAVAAADAANATAATADTAAATADTAATTADAAATAADSAATAADTAATTADSAAEAADAAAGVADGVSAGANAGAAVADSAAIALDITAAATAWIPFVDIGTAAAAGIADGVAIGLDATADASDVAVDATDAAAIIADTAAIAADAAATTADAAATTADTAAAAADATATTADAAATTADTAAATADATAVAACDTATAANEAADAADKTASIANQAATVASGTAIAADIAFLAEVRTVQGTQTSLQTQTMSIADQLSAGIRSLDLQGAKVNGTINLNAGQYFTGVTLQNALNDMTSFLQANPSETIVVKLSDSDTSAPTDLNTLLNSSQYQGFIYSSSNSATTPDLGQVRGKIIIIPSGWTPAADQAGQTIGWQPTEVVHDSTTETDPATLWSLAQNDGNNAGLTPTDQGTPSTLYRTNLSDSTTTTSPVATGDSVNALAEQYFATTAVKRTTGIVGMDDPDPNLIAEIINESNLPITVTSDADTGTGTLRDAITRANSQSGVSSIELANPLMGSTGNTIVLQTDLPQVTNDLVIGTGLINLNGHQGPQVASPPPTVYLVNGLTEVGPNTVAVDPVNITYGTALDKSQLNGIVTDSTGASIPGTFTYTTDAGKVLSAANGHSEAVTFTPTNTSLSPSTGTVIVNVAKATPTITTNVSPVTITYGTALDNSQLISGTASVPGKFVYTSAAGRVLHAGNGQHESVTFIPTDTTDYTSVSSLTVTVNVAQATPTVTVNPVNIGFGTALDNTQLSGTATFTVGGNSVTVPGTFSYTSAAGTVLNGGSGQSKAVTFTPADTTDYATVSSGLNVTVNVSTHATPTVDINPVNITYGTALDNTQLSGTAIFTLRGKIVVVPGSFTYTSAAGSVLNAATNGQSEAVTFTPTDTTTYATVSSGLNVIVNVAQATPTISSVKPVNITYGTALDNTQLSGPIGGGTATFTVGGNPVTVPGTFTYTSAAGSVLNAATNGQSEAVTFTPTDTTDYTPASGNVTVNVAQATPTVTVNPVTIIYGTALDKSQLKSGTATFTVDKNSVPVDGTFTYTSPPSSPLPIGSESEAVTFTPTDTKDYTTVSLNVTVNVLPIPPTVTVTVPSNEASGVYIYNGQPFPATGTATGVGGVNIATPPPPAPPTNPTFYYYLASAYNSNVPNVQLINWPSGLPTSGKNLVIAGTDSSGLLHIRIFDANGVLTDAFETSETTGSTSALHLVTTDASGKVLSDKPESSIPAQVNAITTLKTLLPGLSPSPPHVLTVAQTAQVLGEATSIVGKTNLSNPNAAQPLPGAPIDAGNYVAVAAFTATGNYGAGGAVTNLSIAPATTATTITSSANPAVYGQPITYTATVKNTSGTTPAPVPAGKVQFDVDGGSNVSGGQTVLVTLDANGQAVLTDTFLSKASHTVQATYIPSTNSVGNKNFVDSSNSLTQNVLSITTEPDPSNPTLTDLFIGSSGTTTNDQVQVSPVGSSITGSTGVNVQTRLNGVNTQTPYSGSTIYVYLQNGNETVTMASTLTINAFVTATGNGNENVTLGNGNNTVTLLGGGNDNVTAGKGNNTVMLGNGNENVQLGDGSNVVVEGNGNDNVTAGNGNNLIVGGLGIVAGRGHDTIKVGNGTNILIAGSATVNNSGDSFRQILNAWTIYPTASNQSAIRQRFTVNYNPNASTLTAGSGIDWFFYKPPTTSNKKSTDFLN